MLLTKYYSGVHKRLIGWTGRATRTEKRNAYGILAGKAEGNIPLASKLRCEENIETGL